MSSKKNHDDKQTIAFSATLPTSQAIDQLEKILESLRTGAVHVQHGLQGIALDVADQMNFELQAKRKGQQESLNIVLQWEHQDAQSPLVITSPPGGYQSTQPHRTRTPVRPHYEDWTREELYERAKEIDLEGRSEMNKEQLINALQSNQTVTVG